MPNTLYYGDNLDVLRRYIKDESVALVYLDPPFKSDQSYNVLFAEQNGSRSTAQIQAFEDTWQWDQTAAGAYQEVVEMGGGVSRAMQAFRTCLGESNMLAYLSMMAPRLVELKRVLKSDGSIYLHCDPTASHYLKMLLDAIFGARNFRNEIVWKRSSAHSDTKQGMKRYGKIHDVLLFCTKGSTYTWNPVYTPYEEDYLDSEYRHVSDDGRHYKETDLTAAKPGGDTEYEWPVRRRKTKEARWEPDLASEHENPKPGYEYKSVVPYQGRYWAYSRDNLEKFAKEGRLIHRKTGMPRVMQFADEMPGVSLQDLWCDIPPELGAADLGYPTQKPEALLERIILTASNEGDVVLDPFCGCGTAVAVAQRLNRRWIGVDVTHLAVTLIKHRLQDAFGKHAKYKVVGEPVDRGGAELLAKQDPYQFQWWALGLVGARPTDQKRGADKGIDGRIYFHDEADNKRSRTKQVIFSVKAGKAGVAHIRDLRGVIEREEAAVGVLISMQKPTKDMRKEAASAGFYDSPWGTKHAKIQILTVEELLAGGRVDYPKTGDVRTFKKAPRVKPRKAKQREFFDEASELLENQHGFPDMR